jgi:hypothetical protein
MGIVGSKAVFFSCCAALAFSQFHVVALKADTEAWRQKAIKAVRSEKQVVEAMFPNNSNASFWASMRDNKTRRDGFAEYLCLVLNDSGMPKGEFVVITIWDAGSMARGVMREIGRHECQFK